MGKPKPDPHAEEREKLADELAEQLAAANDRIAALEARVQQLAQVIASNLGINA